MHFVKASPSEFLIVSRGGEVTNRGLAGSALIWPGASWVLVPSTKQEAAFEMTQETADGVPLRFKGIVLYHVEEPVRAARMFDFCLGGLAHIAQYLAHICLGELRSVAAHLPMKECIEQRKTTLTDAIAKALQIAVRDWGIALDVVQVAQVFIVDPELRRQLESEVRNQIKATGELAAIEAEERVKQAAIESRRKVLADEVALKKAEQELVQIELAVERARQDLRLRALPVEQAPRIARALRGMFAGARISLMGGETAKLAQLLAPLVDAALGVAHAGDPGLEASGEVSRDGDQENGVR